jgi:putative phosphoribosyl transferase
VLLAGVLSREDEAKMSTTIRFPDRRAAGRLLAQALISRGLVNPVVLALPRGGLPVAAEIAKAMRAPLDIMLVRKVGVPYQPELAVAAVVDAGAPEIVVNKDVAEAAGVSRAYIDEAAMREFKEIERRRKAYLEGRVRVALEGRAVILVDDGIATGVSVRAAVRALRQKRTKSITLAVPVAPQEAIAALSKDVDIVCLATPEPFFAIGLHYVDFHQLSDQEVIDCLAEVPPLQVASHSRS